MLMFFQLVLAMFCHHYREKISATCEKVGTLKDPQMKTSLSSVAVNINGGGWR